MSDTITTATTTATSVNYGETIKVTPMTVIDPGVASITICGGPNYCPYKKDIEKNIRKEIKTEMFKQHKQPKFGGGFYALDESGNTILIYIKKVIYNAPATIVFWSDGTKTVAKCDERDVFNPEMGLLLCYIKRTFGNETVHKLLLDWSTRMDCDTITLSEVRKRNNSK